MKKYYPLVLLILLLSSCGQIKSESPKSYQTKLNSVFYKNTGIVVDANLYLDRVDINVQSSIANALLKNNIDNYADDNQSLLQSDINLEIDVNTDIESVNIEFPDAKTTLAEPALVTGGGGSGWTTAVNWSAKFNSPPMQWQVVDLVVKIKFKQFEEPIQFEFSKMADVSPDLQQ